ncbi:MAG: glutathione S-transferase family protein, partial [Bacteroidota bacterium]
MGDGVVNWAYYNFMKDKRLVWESFTTGVPWYEKLACVLGYRYIRDGMIAGLGLSDEVAAE